MKILIAGLATNPQYLRLKEEGEKKGHIVDGCRSTELTIYSSGKTFKPTLRGKTLFNYDLIYLVVSKRRWEWYAAAKFLKDNYKTIIVEERSINPISPELQYPVPLVEYLSQAKNDLPYPKSVTFYSQTEIGFVTKYLDFPMIVKSSVLHKGKGVYLANNMNELLKAIENLSVDGSAIIAREYIPNDGDIRIFTIGYKAVAAMKRIPKKGEFRSNISIGGTGVNFEIDKYPIIKDIAEKAAKSLQLEIAGVDIIINKKTQKPYLLEVNSAPQFEGLERYSKVNVAGQMIKYFESLLSKS